MFTARTFPGSSAVVTDRSTAERMNKGISGITNINSFVNNNNCNSVRDSQN